MKTIQLSRVLSESDKLENEKDKRERLKTDSGIFENTDTDYSRKLFLIENCIYGIDIQPIAVQITKLRFFISLIIEQVPEKRKANYGITPLPNLETKFI